jgi:hypothetical protein
VTLVCDVASRRMSAECSKKQLKKGNAIIIVLNLFLVVFLVAHGVELELLFWNYCLSPVRY